MIWKTDIIIIESVYCPTPQYTLWKTELHFGAPIPLREKKGILPYQKPIFMFQNSKQQQ